eukprot:TRINITY_DN9948_c0_g1_i1.p1 TRINITY_DN9948_c0_g1~~TRINITY_DN9948_c0_g1_i1.p1  ORF type:complete len:205 (-),score=20.19 TRINITY_DN9948_c0_g1_i1:139-753(-)
MIDKNVNNLTSSYYENNSQSRSFNQTYFGIPTGSTPNNNSIFYSTVGGLPVPNARPKQDNFAPITPQSRNCNPIWPRAPSKGKNIAGSTVSTDYYSDGYNTRKYSQGIFTTSPPKQRPLESGDMLNHSFSRSNTMGNPYLTTDPPAPIASPPSTKPSISTFSEHMKVYKMAQRKPTVAYNQTQIGKVKSGSILNTNRVPSRIFD